MLRRISQKTYIPFYIQIAKCNTIPNKIYKIDNFTNKNKKLYIPWSLLISTCSILSGIGYSLYICKNENITLYELFIKGLEKFEEFNEKSLEYGELILDRLVPISNEPLLLDLETLKFPEFIPTLVIDLNKTILHMHFDRIEGWKVVKRPGADEFFKQLQHYYELVVWSDDLYPVALDIMIKWGIPVSGVLHRDQCKRKNGHYIKDINKLGRRLDRIIFIDHDKYAFGNNINNGIEIKEYNGDPNDRELYDLIDILKNGAIYQGDIRDYIKKYGGGDINIGRRYLIEKKEQENIVEKRKSISKAFQSNIRQNTFDINLKNL
eukprot:GHVL01012486.1.p1 GENE.GHVL01012486.1~~GHVL01012486.1.p1  ORF type:complete len:321 (+),score=94.47 GHVL01012486.1:84-1046(+)